MFRYAFSALIRSRSNCPYSTSSLGSAASSTAAYLTNTCGLPPDKAAAISKLVTIGKSESADSLFDLLRSNGFSHAQLGALVARHPLYLLADAENNLKPKIQYLLDIGIARGDLPQILCSNKSILSKSLKNHIAPTFEFLKQNVTTYEDLVTAIRQASRILGSNVKKYMVPNIATLRAHRVPESLIRKLMIAKPVTLMLKPDLFEEAVAQIEDLGLHPSNLSFVLGINALALQSRRNWDTKRELFRRFGWSDEEFLTAFRVQPMMMLCSEAKLMDLMEFFVGPVGLLPSQLTKCPNLFLVSLKKRVIPRCSVFQALLSSGKMEKRNLTVISALNMSKMIFIRKYVIPYQESVPDVRKAIEGKIEFTGFTDKLCE